MPQENPHFIGRGSEIDEVILAARSFRFVTLYGLPRNGKTTIALEALRRLEGTRVVWCNPKTTAQYLENNAVPGWVVLDSVDALSPAANETLRTLVATRPTTWIATSRRRLGIPNEASVAIGHLPFNGVDSAAGRLLDHLLRARGVHLDPSDLAELSKMSDGQIGALEIAADQIELLGHSRFISDYFPRYLEKLVEFHSLHLAEVSPPGIAALADLSTLSTPFDAQAFEEITQKDLTILMELIDRNIVEKTPQDAHLFWLPHMIGIAATRVGPPDDERIIRHAQWAVSTENRHELLRVAQNARSGDLQDLGQGVSAVARLCRGATPPVDTLDWAIKVAKDTSHNDLADLLIERAKASLRRSDVNEAQALADEAAELLGDAKTSRLQRLRASITRIVSPSLAVEEFERALNMPGGRSTEALLNHATALWESGEHERAQQATELALGQARSANDTHLEGILLSNLGVMRHNTGNFSEAREYHSMAARCHEAAMNFRFSAITQFDVATIDHEQGALKSARNGYMSAIESLNQSEDLRMSRLAQAALSAVEAQLGLAPNHGALSSKNHFLSVSDTTFSDACALYERIVQLISGVDVKGPSPSDFTAHTEYQTKSDEVQVPARILAQLAHHIDAGSALVVGPQRTEFRIGEQIVDLDSRGAYRNIFQLLVGRRLAGVSQTDIEDILSAGWPDEIIESDAAKNRIHVALSALRRLGLRSVLVKSGSGYALDPSIPVILATTTFRLGSRTS